MNTPGTEQQKIVQVANLTNCLFDLFEGCVTPPLYYAHAIGTQRPVEKKKKKKKKKKKQ